MLRGLSVSVEMNGDLILDTADTMTRSLVVVSGVHCTATVTSVSTVSGSVTMQVRVCEVPSYSGPLGTLRATAGVGTAWSYIHSQHTAWKEYLHLIVTGMPSDVEVMLSATAGETSVP